jgi:hypothetical protein
LPAVSVVWIKLPNGSLAKRIVLPAASVTDTVWPSLSLVTMRGPFLQGQGQ